MAGTTYWNGICERWEEEDGAGWSLNSCCSGPPSRKPESFKTYSAFGRDSVLQESRLGRQILNVNRYFKAITQNEQRLGSLTID
ncbi:hypothetical protein L218DRAFT_376224 [Marasmius fiardii PR-910]|nr:hypothetical protein L218DRAFT_376224 [Marasmius fiardii PR-910]